MAAEALDVQRGISSSIARYALKPSLDAALLTLWYTDSLSSCLYGRMEMSHAMEYTHSTASSA